MTPIVIEIDSIIYIVLGFIGVTGGIFTLTVKLLKGHFVTKEDCKLSTDTCHAQVCQKIDKVLLRIDDIERKREDARHWQQARDLWIMATVQQLADKAGIKIDRMPIQTAWKD